MKTYTKIDEIYVCNDCGAYADKVEDVQHHPSCEPRGSDRWREFYNEVMEGKE